MKNIEKWKYHVSWISLKIIVVLQFYKHRKIKEVIFVQLNSNRKIILLKLYFTLQDMIWLDKSYDYQDRRID